MDLIPRFSGRRVAATFALGAVLLGCAYDTSTEELEGAATLERATEVREGQMTSKEFASMLQLMQLEDCSVVVEDGHGVATPSAIITSFMFPEEHPPNPAAHAIRFEIPPLEYNVGPFHYEVTISTLQSEAFEASIEDTYLRGRVKLNGRIHVHHWLLPDADLVIDSADATAKIVRQNGQTALGGITLDITNHVENCGTFSWCNSFINGALPKVNAKAREILEQKAREMLALEASQKGTVAILQKLEDTLSGATPPYIIDPATIRIEERALRYRAARTMP
jgi:hypothetical protein